MTTMMCLYDAPTEVFFCDSCGHLQTTEIVDIDDYYNHQYTILAESEEEDTLYEVRDGRRVFQVEHRCDTLLAKVDLPRNARVLGFGCAKGAVVSRLHAQRPDTVPHFFDVTERYAPFWRAKAPQERWAAHQPKAAWKNTFDLVTSFYVMEHVSDPVGVFAQQTALLKEGGIAYCLVPNTYANPADFICADHVQHFSESSLIQAMHRAGLQVLSIDAQAHASGFIAMGRKVADPVPPVPATSVAEHRAAAEEIARYWLAFSARVQAFEASHQGLPSSIYGAGFYGRFIATCLKDAGALRCFVDQSPFLQGTLIRGRPVVAPADLLAEVGAMYVGLNPHAARAIIADITDWRDRPLAHFYP
jgi:SAM-dependent methyltransferase